MARPLCSTRGNVVLHAAVSALLFLLLSALSTVPAAFVGALLFAVHPVHVEAVANVVGQGELLAAGSVLLAVHLYLRGTEWTDPLRALLVPVLVVLYLSGLGSKEIAVTLPALLVLAELARRSPDSIPPRLVRSLPMHAALAAAVGHVPGSARICAGQCGGRGRRALARSALRR